MSVLSAVSGLQQVERQIEKLEKSKSDAEAEVVKLDKSIAKKEVEIAKSSSASTIKTKQNQLKQMKDKRAKAAKDASNFGSKLAKLVPKKHDAEKKLREEQQKENDKENSSLKQTMSELSEEFREAAPIRKPNEIMQCVRPLIESYPDALSLFNNAAEKYEDGSADRNALDDIRLCFEKVLQGIFANQKSLENQEVILGRLLKGSGLSNEFRNMLNKLFDYYTKYQNNHIKHKDDVNKYEVSFIIELTCIFMKQMIEQFGEIEDKLEKE